MRQLVAVIIGNIAVAAFIFFDVQRRSAQANERDRVPESATGYILGTRLIGAIRLPVSGWMTRRSLGRILLALAGLWECSC